MSLGLLARQPLTWDSEAAAYILQVEAADGQSLEPEVARAINTFVIDCKVRGIWGAIKSCCLLSGARTLNGALIPLKGAAPTNINFINSDYNRETGLKGNGTSKYLNTNISSVSPLVSQNNLHFSISISSINSLNTSRAYIADSARNMYRTNSSTSAQFNINGIFGSSGGDSTMISSTGFCGLSRNNSQNFTIRVSGRNRTYSSSSVNETTYLAGTETFRIFGRNGNGSMTEFSDGRISFYSIGENIDLMLLEQSVNRFNETLLRFFYPSLLHTEASRWISLAEATSSRKITATTANALNTFCTSIDSANLRSKFYRLNLFCGNDLSSCLIPLYRGQSPLVNVGNITDINNNFILGDYIETGSSGGLKGNGSNKYLSTGITTSIAGVPTITFSSYADSMETSGSSVAFVLVGMLRSNLSFKGAALNSYWNFSTGQRRFDINGESTGVTPNQSTPLSSTGFISGGHVSGTKYAIFSNGVEINSSNATITTPTGVENSQYFVFARNTPTSDGGISPSNFTSSRIKAYHIGTSMTEADQQTFYSIMQAFQTSLERQV